MRFPIEGKKNRILIVAVAIGICLSSVAYATFLPGMAGQPNADEQVKAVLAAHYVGSQACQSGQ